MRRSILLCCSLVLASSPSLAADPIGEWKVANGYANIRVEKCGPSLWGVLSWEKTPGGRDNENPDPALKGRPMLGVPILLDMKPGKDRWDGHVYNSENGKTYIANIKLLNPNTLRIEGCVLGGLFCGGEEWTRVSTPAPNAPAPKSSAKGLPASQIVAAGEVCSRIKQ